MPIRRPTHRTPDWLCRLIAETPLLAERKRGLLRAGELKIKDWLEFDGTIEAAGDTQDGSTEGKLESPLILTAYTGKAMDLNGWPYPVVIDLRGARYDKKVTPIIADHKTERRVGHTTEQVILRYGQHGTLNGKSLVGPFMGAVGTRSSDMEIAKGIVADLKRGFPFQVSVGAKVVSATFVDEEESAYVNGMNFEGPCIIANRAIVRELSVLVLGADNDTSTVIAARLKKETDMEFEDFLADLGLVLAEMKPEQIAKYKRLWAGRQDPEPEPIRKKKAKRKLVHAGGGDDPDEEEEEEEEEEGGGKKTRRGKRIKAGARRDRNDDDPGLDDDFLTRRADEEDRIDEIKAVANRFSNVDKLKIGSKELTLIQARSHAIREKWSPDQFELHCRRASYPDLTDNDPAIHMAVKDVEAKALECAILRQAMIPMSAKRADGTEYGLESQYDDKVLEASDKKQYRINNSIDNLLALQVKAAGKNLGYLRGESANLMAEAYSAYNTIKASGFSTLNIVNVLENVMHKAAWSGFTSTEGVWRQITAVRPLNDFKVHSLYRLDYSGHFRKVAADGELKHISMVDTKKTIQAETFGAMITIDRKTRVNDDLGVVVSQARGFGSLGALRIEEAIMVLLLSNPGSFFAAGNNNLITGAGSALGLTSLETAQTTFRNQVINGKPIAVAPSIMLVGTNAEVLSGRLYKETRTEVTTTADTQRFVDNPFAGRYRPVVSGYLNNTAITDQDGKAVSGQSSTQWFLFADPNSPQGSALVIGFLNGRETPYFDEQETQFNIPGGIQMRSYFDFGVAMHIIQMALKSAGA